MDTAPCIAALEEWRERRLPSLSPRGRAFLLEASTLRRYAVARNGDVAAATAALDATLAWREGELAPPLSCPACDVDPLSHCFFVIGRDENRRPIVYSSMRRAKINDAGVTVRHMTHTLEHAFAAEGSGSACIWIVDFHGFTLGDAMQVRTSTKTMQTFSAHFPERLGAVLLLSPPSLFDMLLAVVRPFIDARTLGKVAILRPPSMPSKEPLSSHELAPMFAPHGIKDVAQLSWLARVLHMKPVPGSLPPLDSLGPDAATLALPRGDARSGLEPVSEKDTHLVDAAAVILTTAPAAT